MLPTVNATIKPGTPALVVAAMVVTIIAVNFLVALGFAGLVSLVSGIDLAFRELAAVAILISIAGSNNA